MVLRGVSTEYQDEMGKREDSRLIKTKASPSRAINPSTCTAESRSGSKRPP